jgi:hypothetical protein
MNRKIVGDIECVEVPLTRDSRVYDEVMLRTYRDFARAMVPDGGGGFLECAMCPLDANRRPHGTYCEHCYTSRVRVMRAEYEPLWLVYRTSNGDT